VLLVERLSWGPHWEVYGGVGTPSVPDVELVTGAHRFEIRGELSYLPACAVGVGVWDLVLGGIPADASYEGSRDGCSNESPEYHCSVASLILSSQL
jgi:hypothetical protein